MPFISAGGTSLSVFMGAIGVLMNVSIKSEYEVNYKDKKLLFTLVNNKKSKA